MSVWSFVAGLKKQTLALEAKRADACTQSLLCVRFNFYPTLFGIKKVMREGSPSLVNIPLTAFTPFASLYCTANCII